MSRNTPTARTAARPTTKPVTGAPLDVLDATFAAEARDEKALPPPTIVEFAFAGRSNVGKSTLLNALCQRKSLARTSRTPGCTRGVIFFDVKTRNGQSFRVVDLPGYGFAERSHDERRQWRRLIEGYLTDRPVLRAVAVLIDPRRGVEPDDTELIGYLSAIGVPFVVVATKVDKLSKSERSLVLQKLRTAVGTNVIATSGEDGGGREELLKHLLRLGNDTASEPQRTNERPR